MRLNKFNKKLKKEYENTINEEKNFFQKLIYFIKNLKFRHYFLAAVSFLFVFLIVEHIAVLAINNNYEKKANEVTVETINQNNKLNKIESNKEYKKIKVIEQKYKRISFLQLAFDVFPIGCTAKDSINGGAMMSPEYIDDSNISGINSAHGNSYNTNVQTEGIDESDIAKCDGEFIYSLSNGMLYVFNKNQEKIASYTSNKADELYIYNKKIVLINDYSGIDILELIYENNNYSIKKLNSFEGKVCLSRLTDNFLYLVLKNSNIDDNRNYDNLYCADYLYTLTSLYTLVSYDLNTNAYKEADVVNGTNDAKIYMSKNHIYVSATYYEYKKITAINVFDLDLNPIGCFSVCGTLNNQFSMDEYNNYFRVVSTDTTMENERLNAISIFNLETLELVGYLNEGIGKGRQTIKSVRFDENTCYVVTYLTQDPLYEIDCSDPTNPVIKSQYEAPGYSSYLHTFTINNQDYLIGLGYHDTQIPKISIYKKYEEKTEQIGSDFLIGPDYYMQYNDIYIDYEIDDFKYDVFNNHKALFLYNDNQYLYVGFSINAEKYLIFKIDVENEENIITVYKDINHNVLSSSETRCFLIDYKLYIPINNELLIEDFNIAN